MFSHERAKDRRTVAPRWFTRIMSTVLLTFLGIELLLVLFVIALQKLSAFREWMRHFNQRTLNPAILNVAGRSGSPYAVVHHVGRRSGRTYATPVRVRPTPEGFLIPLPYGSNVDWCRNILAAGHCRISWQGNDYTLGEPEVVDAVAALSFVPLPKWRAQLWKVISSRGPLKEMRYVSVKRLSAVPEGTIAVA